MPLLGYMPGLLDFVVLQASLLEPVLTYPTQICETSGLVEQ
jgi:hypothetical protein